MNYIQRKIYSDYANVHAVCQEALSISAPADVDAILIGGSLLGIVRDSDFLPWDKDIDFAVFGQCIPKAISLERQFRDKGFECRVHHVGIREPSELNRGLELICELSAKLVQCRVCHVLAGGALLSMVRDAVLHPETDTVTFLTNNLNEEHIQQLNEQFGQQNVFTSFNEGAIKSLCILCDNWRLNLFCEVRFCDGWGWKDLNCEYSFSHSLLEDVDVLNTKSGAVCIPKFSQSVLVARYGNSWQNYKQPSFQRGRVPAFLQVYKDGVMVDYIAHYACGDLTYWFEPTANMISTMGFIPYAYKDTAAGKLLLPEHPEIFLQEHYGDWKIPVKSWNGAVDNPTLVPQEIAMQAILNKEKPE